MENINNINNVISIISEQGIKKEDILAIFLHGSSTAPYLNASRDFDFIVVVSNGTAIHKTFIKNKNIEIFIYSYNTFISNYCSLNNRILPHYCYTKLLYNTNIKNWPLPFNKKDPKIIKAILEEFINHYIGDRQYYIKEDKYLYWFLIWAKDLGCNISIEEIKKVYINFGQANRDKYK